MLEFNNPQKLRITEFPWAWLSQIIHISALSFCRVWRNCYENVKCIRSECHLKVSILSYCHITVITSVHVPYLFIKKNGLRILKLYNPSTENTHSCNPFIGSFSHTKNYLTTMNLSQLLKKSGILTCISQIQG